MINQKNVNKKFISNGRKHVLVENELNELSEKFKVISTKGLTKDLINKFSILQYFFFQKYLIFVWYFHQLKKYTKYYSGTTWIDLLKSNGMAEENIENITKSDS